MMLAVSNSTMDDAVFSTLPFKVTSTAVNATKCQNRRTPVFLIFSILPSVSMIINGFVLVALMSYRSKLRQNNVYVHVGSTLLANMAFSLLAFYQILSLYFSLDGQKNLGHDHEGAVREDVRVWWSFYRALVTAMFLIICGNIGILVSSIRDTTHAPLLFGSRALELNSSSDSTMDEGRKLAKLLSGFDRKRRHRRTWVLIALVWILPLIFVTSAPLGWSCAYSCICLSGCYPRDELDSLERRACSRVWPPMRYDWLVVSIGLWFISVVVVIAILWRTVTDTKRHFRYCSIRVKKEADRPTTQGLKSNEDKTISVTTHLTGTADDVISPVVDVKETRHRSLIRSHQVLRRTLSSLRFIIWIIALFVFSTAPVMALMLYDYFSVENPSMVLGNSCLCVTFVYCWVCPFLLAKCLPGIRQAFISLALQVGKTGSSKRSEMKSTSTMKSRSDF